MLHTHELFSTNRISPGRLALRMKEPFIAILQSLECTKQLQSSNRNFQQLFYLTNTRFRLIGKRCQKDVFLHALFRETPGTASLSNSSRVREECGARRGHLSLLSCLRLLLRCWLTSRVFSPTCQGNSAKSSPPFPKGLLKSTL